MRRLKILHTPGRFYPFIGGVERYVLDLARQQVQQGHQVTVVCANDPISPPVGNIDGVTVVRLPYKLKVSNTDITLRLLSTLVRMDMDIIHTHIPTPWSADISCLVALLKHKPLIVTYHNDIIKSSGYEKVIAGIYNRTMLRLLLGSSDKVVVTQPSYLEYSLHLKRYRNKVAMIPVGVRSPKNLDSVPRAADQVFFLSVLDQYHEYKGLAVLLEAIALVKVKRPHVRLVVGGDGVLAGRYKSLAGELGIGPSVTFLGFVPEIALPHLFRESAIFVLPSVGHLEGFGTVALEALSYGTPVVTTAITGSSAFIKGNRAGLVVQPNDSRALAQAITALLAEPTEAEEMGARGAEAVVAEFGWTNVCSQVLELYEGVLRCRS